MTHCLNYFTIFITKIERVCMCACMHMCVCWEKVAGGWRRLRYEELHNLYASQDIVRVIKSRRLRWVGM